MAKENFKTGETNKELKSSPETGPEIPTTPEGAKEEIIKKAKESIKKIDNEVGNQEGLEEEASGGELIPGAGEIDNRREEVKESGKEEIKKVVNPKEVGTTNKEAEKYIRAEQLVREMEKLNKSPRVISLDHGIEYELDGQMEKEELEEMVKNGEISTDELAKIKDQVVIENKNKQEEKERIQRESLENILKIFNQLKLQQGQELVIRGEKYQIIELDKEKGFVNIGKLKKDGSCYEIFYNPKDYKKLATDLNYKEEDKDSPSPIKENFQENETEKIQSANSLGELYKIIKEIGGIQGSSEFYSVDEIWERVRAYVNNQAEEEIITRNGRLRDKVRELKYAREQSLKSSQADKASRKKVSEAEGINDTKKEVKEVSEVEFKKVANSYINLSLEELNTKWNETKKLLDEAEKNKDEAAYNENYKVIKEIEKVKGGAIEQAENKISEPEKVEKNEEPESQELEKEKPNEKREIKFSEEVLKGIKELGLKSEDLEKMEAFGKLSEGGQILALKNYDQILVDEAVKGTPEKVAQIKEARKKRYQEKMGQKKGAFMAGLRNFFGSGKREKKAFKESYEDLKNKEDESNKKMALEAAVNWVSNFDVPAKLENGKVKLEFVDGSEFDKETQAIIEELNEEANNFARMPQYMSNISARRSDKKKYEKAQLKVENKKKELEASLLDKKSEGEIINILNSLENKISNLQNNLTDKEREEFEKSDSKFFKFLKSSKTEKVSYLVGGYLSRGAIRSKLSSDSTSELAGLGGSTAVGLASYGTLGVAAAIGGIRGWQREKKKIREEDKKIAKQEYQETVEMKNRKEALVELKKVTPEFLKIFGENEDKKKGETWETYQDRKTKEWLKADPEKAKIYIAKKGEFDQANLEFLKTQKKKFLEFKTEANFIYAESASAKIDNLVNDIYALQDQESLSTEDKERLIKKTEMLKTRLEYTQAKIGDGLLALGLSQNRLTSSTRLFNTIAQASLLIETVDYEDKKLPKKAGDIIGDEYRNDDGTINFKAWAEAASGEDLALYRQTKIKNFLDRQDDKVSSERAKQKAKKAAIGAVSGAAFAFVGMKAFDHLGDTEMGQALKEKIGNAISHGIDQGKDAVEAIKDLFDSSEGLAEAMPSIDEVDAINGAAIAETIDGAINVPPEAPLLPSFEDLKETGALSNNISNEGFAEGKTDSIWHSAREIFTNNAEALGYEGDMSNAGELRGWADKMVAGAINRMDDVKDLVHEGNVIELNQNEAGEYIIELHQAEGLEPGYLPDEAELSERPRMEDIPEKIPRKEINEIPHTYNLPNKEAPDADITLDDLKNVAEEPVVDGESSPDQQELSNIVDNIDEEGGERSGIEESLDRAREAIDQEGGDEVPAVEDVSEEGGEQVSEDKTETGGLTIEDVNEAVESQEKIYSQQTIDKVLDIIANKDNPTSQDKILLEYIKQNNVSKTENLTNLLSKNVFLLETGNPISQELLSFSEIRNATGTEKIDLFYDLLRDKMGNGGSEQFEALEMLKEKGAIKIVEATDLSNDKIAFTLGEKKFNYDFSRQGLQDLSSLLKKLSQVKGL